MNVDAHFLTSLSLSCTRSKSQSAGAGLAVSYFLVRLMHKEEQPSPGTYHVSYNIRMAASMTYRQLETTIYHRPIPSLYIPEISTCWKDIYNEIGP